MQVRPRLRVQSEKLQCVSGFLLPVCLARTSLPGSVTVVFPQNRVARSSRCGPTLLLAGVTRGGGKAARGRGQGRGRNAPPSRGPRALSWAARRTKRLPLHPPRPRSTREGTAGRRRRRAAWRGLGEMGEGRGGGEVPPAGLGRTAPRKEGREEGLGGLGELGGGKDSWSPR